MRWSDKAQNEFDEHLARNRAESVINEAQSGKHIELGIIASMLMAYAGTIDRIRLRALCANPHEDEGEYALGGFIDDLCAILDDECVAPCEKQLCVRCGKEQDMPLCVSCEIAIENGEDIWLNRGYDTAPEDGPGVPR